MTHQPGKPGWPTRDRVVEQLAASRHVGRTSYFDLADAVIALYDFVSPRELIALGLFMGSGPRSGPGWNDRSGSERERWLTEADAILARFYRTAPTSRPKAEPASAPRDSGEPNQSNNSVAQPGKGSSARVATDGGPAFPRIGEGFGNPNYDTPGMSLRDWFAGQALSGLLAKYGWETIATALIAYEFADAMLVARAKHGGKND